MIENYFTSGSGARIVPTRKSFPVAGETSFNLATGDIGIFYETLSNNTVPVCRLRPSVARGAGSHLDLDAPNLLTFDESPQSFGGLVITGTRSFGSIDSTQANPRGRATVGPKLDVVSIDYCRSPS
jgi:hypothetical protein